MYTALICSFSAVAAPIASMLILENNEIIRKFLKVAD